jgi:endonuclease/exonuclease/phosphatase (EEP) superfamily protein YafD
MASSEGLAATAPGARSTGPSARLTLWERGVLLVAGIYPIALVLLTLGFAFVGEHWWVTGVALYAPRFAFGLPLPVLVALLLRKRLRRYLWTQAVAALALVCGVMGFVFPWPIWSSGGKSIRVLAFNVDSGEGGEHYDEVMAEIERYSPDVVLLVEATFIDKVTPLLQERYPTVQTSSQFAIASKYPLVDFTTPPKVVADGVPHSPRYVRVVLGTALGPVTFYVVHPISPRESLARVRAAGKKGFLFGRVFNSSNAQAFYGNSDLREVQVQTFGAQARDEPGPVVVAGDTNLPDLSLVLRQNLSHLDDGFSKAGWGFGYTFPTNKILPPWMRIDRILAGHGLRFVGFQVGTSKVSDHHCVVADLVRDQG